MPGVQTARQLISFPMLEEKRNAATRENNRRVQAGEKWWYSWSPNLASIHPFLSVLSSTESYHGKASLGKSGLSMSTERLGMCKKSEAFISQVWVVTDYCSLKKSTWCVLFILSIWSFSLLFNKIKREKEKTCKNCWKGRTRKRKWKEK